MSLEHVTDHEERGVARVIERYRKPLVMGLLRAWLAEVQQLEDVYWDLLQAIVTRQLDVQGRLVGEAREGRDNAIYLIWIRARVLVNRSSGTPPQLIDIAKAVGAPAVRYEEMYPATAIIHSDAVYDAVAGAQLAKLLQQAKPRGVALYYHWYINTPFRFAPESGVVADSPYGFDHGAFSAISKGGDPLFPLAALPPANALADETGVALTSDDDNDFLTEF